jgi:hypothetical protein
MSNSSTTRPTLLINKRSRKVHRGQNKNVEKQKICQLEHWNKCSKFNSNSATWDTKASKVKMASAVRSVNDDKLFQFSTYLDFITNNMFFISLIYPTILMSLIHIWAIYAYQSYPPRHVTGTGSTLSVVYFNIFEQYREPNWENIKR